MYSATLKGRNPYNFWFIFWETSLIHSEIYWPLVVSKKMQIICSCLLSDHSCILHTPLERVIFNWTFFSVKPKLWSRLCIEPLKDFFLFVRRYGWKTRHFTCPNEIFVKKINNLEKKPNSICKKVLIHT